MCLAQLPHSGQACGARRCPPRIHAYGALCLCAVDFYLDVIAGAITRDRYDMSSGEPVYIGLDEDFMPRELFKVWVNFGQRWLEQEVLKELGLLLVSSVRECMLTHMCAHTHTHVCARRSGSD